jgi:hypothetical protein
MENIRDGSFKKQWTWVYLEQQLNAWFWGNDFERVAMFRLHAGVRYQIGPVGQDTRAVTDGLVQRHLPWPGVQPGLWQVRLVDGHRAALLRSLTLLDEWPIPGAPPLVADA